MGGPRFINAPSTVLTVRSFSIELLRPRAPGKSRIVFTIKTSPKPVDDKKTKDLDACRISMEPKTEDGSTGVLTVRAIENIVGLAPAHRRGQEKYGLSDEEALAAFFFDIDTTEGWTLEQYIEALRGRGPGNCTNDEFTDLTRFEFVDRRTTSLDFMIQAVVRLHNRKMITSLHTIGNPELRDNVTVSKKLPKDFRQKADLSLSEIIRYTLVPFGETPGIAPQKFELEGNQTPIPKDRFLDSNYRRVKKTSEMKFGYEKSTQNGKTKSVGQNGTEQPAILKSAQETTPQNRSSAANRASSAPPTVRRRPRE